MKEVIVVDSDINGPSLRDDAPRKTIWVNPSQVTMIDQQLVTNWRKAFETWVVQDGPIEKTFTIFRLACGMSYYTDQYTPKQLSTLLF